MSNNSNMSRTARRAAEELHEAADDTKNIVQAAASDLLDTAKKAGAQAKEVVRERWDNVRSTASNYVDQGRDKAKEMEKAVEKRIKQRPLTSLLIALGAGFLVGLLCRRR